MEHTDSTAARRSPLADDMAIEIVAFGQTIRLSTDVADSAHPTRELGRLFGSCLNALRVKEKELCEGLCLGWDCSDEMKKHLLEMTYEEDTEKSPEPDQHDGIWVLDHEKVINRRWHWALGEHSPMVCGHSIPGSPIVHRGAIEGLSSSQYPLCGDCMAECLDDKQARREPSPP